MRSKLQANQAMDTAYSDAFFLYAETVRPSKAEAAQSLEGFSHCASGTRAATPDVATYIFHCSEPLTERYRDRWPESGTTESLELYLTPAAFRDHLETDDFRQGLRYLYKSVGREFVQIYWIGATPAPDMLANIFRSDRAARPLAPIALTVFDASTAANAPSAEVVQVSVSGEISESNDYAAIEIIQSLQSTVDHVSFIAFFHPQRGRELRLLINLALDAQDTQEALRDSVAELGALCEAGITGTVLQNAAATPTQEQLQTALTPAQEASSVHWEIRREGYEGYALHPRHSADAEQD